MNTMKDMKNVRIRWCERHREAIQWFKLCLAGLILFAIGFVATVMVFLVGGYNG